MKVTLERLPASLMQLDIEVDHDRLEKSLDAAYKRLATKNKIPGFRPGKAPRAIVERMWGREGLIREAIDRLVPDVYNEAIAAEDVAAIGQPELEILEFDPVRFKATVPVRPTMKLGDYQAIRVESEVVEVTDEMLDEQLTALRRRHATQVPVERPVQWDDILTADLTGTVEDGPFIDDTDAEFQLREGQTLFIEGLAEAFLGMNKGDEKEISLPLADDFQVERLQGKAAELSLHVKEVKEEQLPDLDDEFANSVNAEDFPTLDALKGRMRDELLKSLQQRETARVQNLAVGQLVEAAELDYPKIMVDREIDHLIRESMGNDQQAYVSYLQRVGQSEADFRETLRDAADTSVQRALALAQFAEDESIEVTDADVEVELDSLVAPMGDDAARFREMFGNAEGSATIRRNLHSKKTLERLAAIAAGAPSEPSPEPATEATPEEPSEEEQSA